jgi:hypothetical protein
MTAFASVESAIEALQLGAYDFLRKPFRQQELHAALNRALDHARLRKEVESYRANLEKLVLERTRDVQALLDEVLRLNDLTLAAQAKAGEVGIAEAELLAPFFAHFAERFRPEGWGLALAGARGWRMVVAAGSHPWPDAAALPDPEDLASGADPYEWKGPEGYHDAFLLPLRGGGELLGAVLVGFEARGAFSPLDRGVVLWRRQVEAMVHGMKVARRLLAQQDGQP